MWLPLTAKFSSFGMMVVNLANILVNFSHCTIICFEQFAPPPILLFGTIPFGYLFDLYVYLYILKTHLCFLVLPDWKSLCALFVMHIIYLVWGFQKCDPTKQH